jgi:hypothetical protein
MSSEVARLRRQIQAEYEAGTQALSGLACGTARHQFITARMERTWQLTQELVGLVGIEQAAAVLVETMDGPTTRSAAGAWVRQPRSMTPPSPLQAAEKTPLDAGKCSEQEEGI